MRKAKRKKPKLIDPNTYRVHIIYSHGYYCARVENILSSEKLAECINQNFNSMLIQLFNVSSNLLISNQIVETILYNSKEQLKYNKWPPPLSLTFIYQFFQK